MHRLFLLPLVLLALWGQAADRPNVLFIIADDLGARLACYDDPLAKTPTLDQLAGRGVLFQRCYTQRPTCGPSRASMLTGLYPYESGLHKQKAKLKSSRIPCTSLPALFRENGYQTIRVGKVFHMGVPGDVGKPGNDDPAAWDVAVNNSGWDNQKANLAAMTKHGTSKNDGVRIGYSAPDLPDEEMADGKGTKEAIRLFGENHPKKTGKPLMMFMGYYRPHPPMIAPRRHWDAIAADTIRIPKVAPNDRASFPPGFLYKKGEGDGFNFIPDQVARDYTQAYYAAIHFIDGEVAKLVAALREQGLSDNTIIVFTGDQGFHLGEHGHWHKTSPFEPACHVPLIIVDPRRKDGGKKASGITGLVDLYPTLCELSGVSPKHKLSGQSLIPLMDNPKHPGKPYEITEVGGQGTSVRSNHFRYARLGTEAVLYDYRSDPHEFHNRIADPIHAEIVARLSAVCDRVEAAK